MSHALSAVDPGWLVIINEALASGRLARMYYAESLEAVLVLETAGRTLKVLDVIGADIPDAAALLATVPMEYERVEFHFAPDRLGEGPFAGRAQDPGDCLMVRGSLATAGDVMLPPLGRC